MSYIKNILILIAILLLQKVAFAQEIKLSISKDTIGFNENVELTLSGETNNGDFSAGIPQSDGVMIVSTSDNRSYNSNSGKIKFSRTYTLSPYKTGTYLLGPAWLQLGKRKIYSNKISLVIQSGNKSTISSEVFLKCEVDKKKVVLGEQVTLSLKLYNRVNVYLTDRHPMPNPFNGFYYYEGKVNTNLKDTGVFVNGLSYHVSTIYKEFVFPNKIGTLTIPSYQYVCYVQQNPFPTGDPNIDELMGIQTQIDLVSPPINIQVENVPIKNKPLNFAGDVGSFFLNATLEKSSIKTNEAVNLTVTISGKGNVNFIQLPKINFPSGIDYFTSHSTDSITINDDGLNGEKSFKLTLLAKNAGRFTIPEITFSFFDATKNEFNTLTTPPFQLTVTKNEELKEIIENNLPKSFFNASKNETKLKKISIIVIPQILLLVLIILFYKKRKTKKRGPIRNKKTESENYLEPLKSLESIQFIINEAETLINNEELKAGLTKLYESLIKLLCQQTELSVEEASNNQLHFRLKIKNYPNEYITEALKLLSELSELRYTNSTLNKDYLTDCLTKTRKLTETYKT